jgi:hypothetical protein
MDYESSHPGDLSVSHSPPQRTNKPAGSVRQPVSCEPCRKRKIKCSRTKPPCETCRRRGCMESCVYKKARGEPQPSHAPAHNEELLNRISNLESLLRKHTGAHIPDSLNGFTSPMLSPPMEINQTVQTSPIPGSFHSESPSQLSYSSEHAQASRAHRLGILTTSPTGNVRYEAQSSQWTSVLANTGLSLRTPTLDDPEDSGTNLGMPFMSSPPPSMDELLALLPPTQQCSYLKDTYFVVFSPVICPVAQSRRLLTAI